MLQPNTYEREAFSLNTTTTIGHADRAIAELQTAIRLARHIQAGDRSGTIAALEDAIAAIERAKEANTIDYRREMFDIN